MEFEDNYWLMTRADDGETEKHILISNDKSFKALKTTHLILDEPDYYEVRPMVDWQVFGKGETLDDAIKDCHDQLGAFIEMLAICKKLLEQHIKEAK